MATLSLEDRVKKLERELADMRSVMEKERDSSPAFTESAHRGWRT